MQRCFNTRRATSVQEALMQQVQKFTFWGPSLTWSNSGQNNQK